MFIFQKVNTFLNSLSWVDRQYTLLKILLVFCWFNLLRLYFLIFFWKRPSIPPPEFKDNFKVTHGVKSSSSIGFYLSDEEISEFENNGFLGPIKILERNEALKLGEIIHSKVMEGDIVMMYYISILSLLVSRERILNAY